MSKRDEMRKLREMRMKQLSETDRSTPAEEAAQKAEEATKDNEDIIRGISTNTVDSVATKTKSEIHNARPTKSEAKKAENVELNDVATSVADIKSAVNPNPSEVSRLDFTYRAKDRKCGLTHTTIMLTDDCMNILKTRSLQMGMNQQDYFNMLIEEDRTVVDNASGELTPDERILGKIDLHGKKSKNITITIDNYRFMKKAAALRGISQTNYANYIILKEHIREEKEGRRPGKYDTLK